MPVLMVMSECAPPAAGSIVMFFISVPALLAGQRQGLTFTSPQQAAYVWPNFSSELFSAGLNSIYLRFDCCRIGAPARLGKNERAAIRKLHDRISAKDHCLSLVGLGQNIPLWKRRYGLRRVGRDLRRTGILWSGENRSFCRGMIRNSRGRSSCSHSVQCFDFGDRIRSPGLATWCCGLFSPCILSACFGFSHTWGGWETEVDSDHSDAHSEADINR